MILANLALTVGVVPQALLSWMRRMLGAAPAGSS